MRGARRVRKARPKRRGTTQRGGYSACKTPWSPTRAHSGASARRTKARIDATSVLAARTTTPRAPWNRLAEANTGGGGALTALAWNPVCDTSVIGPDHRGAHVGQHHGAKWPWAYTL